MTQTEIHQRDAIVELLDNDDLDGFEKDFATTMKGKEDDDTITDKQSETLERIYNKHCRD